MNTWMRLGVPAACGLLAFVIDLGVLSARFTPHRVTAVRRMIAAGEVIEAAALDETSMLGDPDRLRATFVPAEDREVIVGAICQRELHPGDPILWRDVRRASTGIEAGPGEHVLPVDLAGVAVESAMLFANDLINFWVAPPQPEARKVTNDEPQIIGPFRVLSVGTDTSFGPDLDGSPESGGRRRGNERVICVAVKLGPDGKYDAAARRLIDAVSGRRLLALVVRPGGRADAVARRTDDPAPNGSPRSQP